MRRPQNWKKSPTCFDKIAVFTKYRQNKWEIFSNFCGLLRISELYLTSHTTIINSFKGKNPELQSKLILPIGHFILIRIFAVIVEINTVYNSQIEQQFVQNFAKIFISSNFVSLFAFLAVLKLKNLFKTIINIF